MPDPETNPSPLPEECDPKSKPGAGDAEDPDSLDSSRVWIERAKREPDAASVWSHLHARYVNRLQVYAAQRMSKTLRRVYDVEEVMNMAMYRAARHIDHFEYRRQGSFLDWLQRQVDWVILDLARGHRRKPPLDVVGGGGSDDSQLGLPEPAHEGRGPATEARQRDLVQALIRSLDEVPILYREVLVQHHLQNRSIQDIAKDLGRKANTVSQQLKRGLEIWRDALGDDPSGHL
jgi:RNA polymerase sigma-70 factor (ECF subfamily)